MRTNVPTLTCLRCAHSWVPRQVEIRICPKCKSAYWDVPRKDVAQDSHRSILVGSGFPTLSGLLLSGQFVSGYFPLMVGGIPAPVLTS